MTKRKRGNIFTIPYCLLFAKPASFKLKTRANLLLALGFRAASTKNKVPPYFKNWVRVACQYEHIKLMPPTDPKVAVNRC